MDVILDRGSTPLTSRTKKGTLQEFLSFYTGLWNGLVEFTRHRRTIRIWTRLQQNSFAIKSIHAHFRSDVFFFLFHIKKLKKHTTNVNRPTPNRVYHLTNIGFAPIICKTTGCFGRFNCWPSLPCSRTRPCKSIK